MRQIGDAAAQEWVPRAIARNIDLGFVLENAIVSGNPLLLSELLNNLVDNALRYTPPGGTVTVRSGTDDGGHPYLSVEDNGVGIPEDARGKVVAIQRKPCPDGQKLFVFRKPHRTELQPKLRLAIPYGLACNGT